MGRAYAFMHYKGNTDDLQSEMYKAKGAAKTPKELKFLWQRGKAPKNTVIDLNLAKIIDQAEKSPVNHVARVEHPNMSNSDVAREAATIMNAKYSSPLYKKGERFHGEVVYHDGNKYSYTH